MAKIYEYIEKGRNWFHRKCMGGETIKVLERPLSDDYRGILKKIKEPEFMKEYVKISSNFTITKYSILTATFLTLLGFNGIFSNFLFKNPEFYAFIKIPEFCIPFCMPVISFIIGLIPIYVFLEYISKKLSNIMVTHLHLFCHMHNLEEPEERKPDNQKKEKINWYEFVIGFCLGGFIMAVVLTVYGLLFL